MNQAERVSLRFAQRHCMQTTYRYKIFLALIAFVSAAIGLAAFAQAPKPAETDASRIAETANNFLQSYSKLRSRGLSGLPGQKDQQQLQHFFTPSLRLLFAAALKEQQRCKKRFPSDKPPWIEGDVFSSSFEGFNGFVLENSTINDDGATVIIKYSYKKKAAPAETLSWHDALLFKKIDNVWHIDDMQYRGDFAFGSGFGVSLRQSLQGIPAC